MQYRLFLIDLTREALPITKLTQEGSEVALGQTSACEPDDPACRITQCGVRSSLVRPQTQSRNITVWRLSKASR